MGVSLGLRSWTFAGDMADVSKSVLIHSYLKVVGTDINNIEAETEE